MQRIERELVVPREGFAEGVERAGANIAEDDADRTDRQLQQAIAVVNGVSSSARASGGAAGTGLLTSGSIGPSVRDRRCSQAVASALP
ncbi:hypothetical protein MOP88_18630 [Sphingomonas sp. WKB10]|nr:hypothetical protein [Sphingomonas sp. WKB10]